MGGGVTRGNPGPSLRKALSQSTVDISAVAHGQDQYQESLVLDLVDDAMIPFPDPEDAILP